MNRIPVNLNKAIFGLLLLSAFCVAFVYLAYVQLAPWGITSKYDVLALFLLPTSALLFLMVIAAGGSMIESKASVVYHDGGFYRFLCLGWLSSRVVKVAESEDFHLSVDGEVAQLSARSGKHRLDLRGTDMSAQEVIEWVQRTRNPT